MNKKGRTYLLYLHDMLNEMRKIQSFVKDIDYDEFTDDEKAQDAVIRNFEIIGEASKQVPESIKSKYTVLPWKEMYSLRNIVTHHYFGIDYALIWKIVTDQLAENEADLRYIIEMEKDDN